MTEVPSIVIGNTRAHLLMAVFWLSSGLARVLGMIDGPSWLGWTSLALGPAWLAYYLVPSVTVTRDLIHVRFFVAQHVYRCDELLPAKKVGKAWGDSFVLGGNTHLPFRVSPELLCESIRTVREVDALEPGHEAVTHGVIRGWWI